MRSIATRFGLTFLLLALLGCAKGSDQPPAYAAPQAPLTQTPVLAAAPGPAAATPAPANAALSTPDPLAPGCTVDAHCLTHRCNVPAHKCAWPCQSDNDCIPGNACIKPTCLPKLQ